MLGAINECSRYVKSKMLLHEQRGRRVKGDGYYQRGARVGVRGQMLVQCAWVWAEWEDTCVMNVMNGCKQAN